MRVLRNLLWFVASAVLAAACTHASAQTAGFNEFGSWAYEWANGRFTATLTGPNGQTTSYPMGPTAVGQTVANGAGGATWTRSFPVTLSGSAASQAATATLTAVRTATPRQIATGALSLARKGPLPAALLGIAASAGLEYLQGQWQMRNVDPNYSLHNGCLQLSPDACSLPVGKTVATCYSPGVQWIELRRAPVGMIPPGWESSPGYGYTYCVGNTQAFRRTVSAANGQTPSGDVTYSPAQESDIVDAIESGLTSSPSSAPAAIDEILSNGGDVDASAPAVSGPASATSQPRTTTSSTGSKTSQTTYNITYNNSSYSYSSTTTTTTSDAGGNTTDTTTEDTSPEPGDVDVTPAVLDAAMPPVPTLYERKYPDGIVGVWETRKAELQETGFSAALDALLPDIPDGSGCPQFSLPGGDIAGFAFPGGNLGPPCWVWPWVKVVIVITSLFLARSLVFGG